MRYAIINFTRLGDLLQSQCTIAALKEQNHQVSLICLGQFASATDFIAELDDVTIFPGTEILKAVHENWIYAYEIISTWIDTYYKKFPYDCILNLTPSMACRTFTSLLSQKTNAPIYGFGLDKFGFNYNSSTWTSYIQAVSMERNCSPFNLIDAFRSMLNLAPTPYKLALPQTSCEILQAELIKNNLDSNTQLIGFQLGASDPIRQWSIENFVALAKLIQENNQGLVVLLGSPSEQKLAEKFGSLAQKENIPYINLCGKTSLLELGQVLNKLQVLVSNDTGTLHLACGLNIPVLGIYLATAQVWDTGPYNAGHICLEPRLKCHPCSFKAPCPHNYLCHTYISAQTAWHCLDYLLQNPIKQATDKFIGAEFSDSRIWQGYFESDGFIDYTSLSKENEQRTFWMFCQKVLYKNLISALENKPNKIEIGPEILKNYQSEHFISSTAQFLARLISLLLLAKEQVTMLNLRPSQKAQELLLATIQRIELYFEQDGKFKALLLLWKNFLQENSGDLNQTIKFIDIFRSELEYFLEQLQSGEK